MPSPSFLRRLGMYIEPDFFSPEECARLMYEAVEYGGEQAKVGQAEFAVNEDYRKATCVNLPDHTVEWLRERFIGLLPRLSEHFGEILTQIQKPGLIHYREGDFFKPHSDSSTAEDAQPELLVRKVSVVVFLNGVSQQPSEGCYGGGALTLYGLLEDPEFKKLGVPLDPEPGLLIGFPSDTVHSVTPVTHGNRFTVVVWCY